MLRNPDSQFRRLCLSIVTRCVLASLVVIWSAVTLVAQETARPNEVVEPKKPGQKSDILAPEDSDVIRLLGDDGRVLVLRAGARMKRIMEAIEKEALAQSEKSQAAVPDFQVTSLLLDGRADLERERVELDATLEILVRAGKTQTRVPLRMAEATLLSQSSGDPSKVNFEATDKSAGLTCWLTGEGKHVLKLKLAVALKRTAATQRVQLSLPPNVQSRLTLEVPQSRLTVSKTPESPDILTETIDGNRSRITVHGFGSALDLSWQGARDSMPTKRELQSRTLILAEVLPDGVLLQAGQTIRATQGTFSSVTVRLPAGFKVDEVSDRAGAPLQVVTTPDGRAIVTLSGETSGPVDLSWQLTGALAAGLRVDLNPLSVEEATRQDGMLGVIAPEGFSLRPVDADLRQIDRIGAATFRRFVESALKRTDAVVSQAFSFDGQFRAVFQLERVVASYLVTPSYELKFNGDSVELDATYQLRVYRGAVDSLTLRWPNSKAENWQLDVESDIFVLPEVGPQGDDVLLRFGEPVSRLSEPPKIHVRARRALSNVGSDFPLTVPVVIAPRRAVASLIVRNAGNVESTLTPNPGTVLRLSATDAAPPKTGLHDVPENQRPRRYELPSESASFVGRVTTQSQSIACIPRTTLAVEVDRVRVTQVFEYNVRYERLGQVRLVVPSVLTERAGGLGAQFSLIKSENDVVWVAENAAQEPLTPNLIAGVGAEGRQLRVSLPQPRWGRFRIAAQYTVPLKEALQSTEMSVIDVPLITSADGSPKSSPLQLRHPDNFSVRVRGDAWKPEVALERFPTWGAEGSQPNVELDLRVSPGQASEEFTIRRAAYRLRVDQGVIQTQAAYWIDGDVAYISMELPNRVARSGVRCWWDGKELSREQIQEPDGERQLRLDLSSYERDSWHLLAIEYASEETPQLALHNALRVITPKFASDVWVAESLWEIVLPFDQHLFVYPSGLTPRFRWVRNGIVWARQSHAARLGFPDWVLTQESLRPDAEHADLVPMKFQAQSPGNSYVFSSFGRQNRVEFQTMSQPSIVLSGAGLALLIAFALVRIPGTRHVLTLLVLGVAMALVGIWHFEPVQLLLQPALIGIGLAVAASFVESRIKQQNKLAFVTLSTPSELGVLGSSREERIPVPGGGEGA